MEFHYVFFSGDAANLLHVDASTINRMLHDGRLLGEQRRNGWWLITLDEINRMRQDYYKLPKLTNEEALEYLEYVYEQNELRRKE
jgi:hypothetical protein